ncbi:murein biosynthesis integral membrane protein MurJ [Actinomyces howellii]|uniref:Integral membrane protein MviN n=1 Tax=Actinomyces howellii TaxID=52771 RepID=A0A448HHT9_9ACTO|nr:murein biosynthesis integral membrane protein MurJ [Actinomyces howellii]VEG28792.1 integral membrane protein MviN [Actinomyces howellii]
MVTRSAAPASSSRASSIARSSAVMAVGTLASRILGLVRTALVIAALGATASGAADAFNIANALPTQLYGLLIGGILNAILVPQIVRAMRQDNGEELVNRLLTAASLTIAAVAGVLTVAAPLVVMLTASGLGRWQPLAFAFAFWCMPQVFFYGLYALWGQVLNARSNFGPYMWSPVLNNIISILSLVAYLRIYGGYTSGQDPSLWTAERIALIGGTTTLGIAVQALVLYIPLVRSGFRPRLVFGIRGMGLGGMSKVALWALLGVGAAELGTWATTNLGSRAVTAAETAQYADVIVPSTTMYSNAQMIYMLPQSLVTTSIITALFTRMSEKAAADDARGVRDDLSLGLRSVAVFTVLFAAGIATLSTPALQLFFPSISLEQAAASAPILTILAVGIVFQGIWFTTQRVMLAYADTKRLLWADVPVGIVPVIICLGAYLLAPANHWMAWAAVGSVLSQVVGCVVIVPLMRRHLPSLDGRRITLTYARLVLAALPTVLAGLAVRRLLGPADGTITGSRPTDAAVTVMVTALIMTVVYLVAATLLRVEELRVLSGPLSSVLGRLGRMLPGPAGAVLTRLSRAVRPAPAAVEEDGEEPLVLPRSVPPGSAVPLPYSLTADVPAPVRPPRPFRPAPAPTLADLAAVSEAVRSAAPGTLSPHAQGPWGPGRMSLLTNATPIGSGRYELLSPLPATLPRIVRHVGRDTILDREVTVLVLTAATPHREEVLEAASRAVLVDDARIQRVYDVETSGKAFIVTEPTTGSTLSTLVADGLSPAQVRAIIGELAQALESCSRRGLHHLNLSPDSVRLRPDGTVQLSGVGVEAAALGLDAMTSADPLAADRKDAHALVELLYYGLTNRWPGKRSGIASAPTTPGGAPVPPSRLASEMVASDADLDALVQRAWGPEPPASASVVARALAPWDESALPVAASPVAEPPAEVEQPAPAEGATTSLADGVAEATRGVLSRLRRLSTARPVPRSSGSEPTVTLPTGSGAAGAAASQAPAQPPAPAAPAAEAPAVAAQVPAEAPPAGPPTGAPPASTLHETFATEEEWQEESEERSVSRTSKVVITSLALAMVVGLILAVSNLLQLAGVKISEEDIPAADTVPTTAAPAQEPAAQAVPIVVVQAQPVDPDGVSDEHAYEVANVFDGDPSTQWSSQYYSTSAFGNIKTGLGVALTLEQAATVSGIEIQGTGEGGHVQIRATTPEDPAGGTLLAEGSFASGTTTLTFSAPTTTQSVVVWVTSLPRAADGDWKATISEITLR